MTSISETAKRLLSLEGKVAMVTGAASGIGRGIALRLAELGAAIVILDIDAAGAKSTEERIAQQGKARFEKCDVRSSRACQQAVAAPIDAFGKTDSRSCST